MQFEDLSSSASDTVTTAVIDEVAPPPSVAPIASLNVTPVCTTTKFRYIIHGVPRNKKYTIEEARWCETTQQFISEQVHTVYAFTLKQWLGYIPTAVGDITTVMWMTFPTSIWDPTSLGSPLDFWDKNKDRFVSHNLDKMRHIEN